MKIDRLIQSDDKSCLPCVLGMMVGESEEYVKGWFEYQDPPLTDEDAMIFLAHHGIYLSLLAAFDAKEPMEDLDNSEVKITFDNRPAYVIVESERFPGRHHAVFWDGRNVLDPSPESKPKRRLSEYVVIGVYPMMMTAQRWEWWRDNTMKAA